MKCFVILLLLYFPVKGLAQTNTSKSVNISPLAVYDKEWEKQQYKICNTAGQISYLSGTEKQVIFILNLMRANPVLFLNTVAKKYVKLTPNINAGKNKFYIETLFDTLNKLKPLPPLSFNEKCYFSANCLAQSEGKMGYIGHDRKTKECKNKSYFDAECITYGMNDPLEIVMNLLIDAGIPSLSHRKICLNPYSAVGINICSHRTWQFIAVLDFLR